MNETLEITVCSCYDKNGDRKIRMLRLLRISLIVCLFMSWTYAIAVAAAFVQEGSGAATQWLLFFAMFTMPATVLLILVWKAISRLTLEFDYVLTDDVLEICSSTNGNRRKQLVCVNCARITAFGPVDQMPGFRGRTIRAARSKANLYALDVAGESQNFRILMQPNAAFIQRLTKLSAKRTGGYYGINQNW